MFIEKINKETLLKPLQTVVGIVERKQPLPILSNVLIEKSSSGIRFHATDMEIQISTEINDVKFTGEEQSITVAAKKLQEILRVLPDNSSITLDIQDSKLLVKVLKSKFTLQTLPAVDFPKVSEQLQNSTTIEIEQKLLKALLGSVQYAMAQQDIRYYLNGVLLVVDGNIIKLIATDGHRLAYTSATLATEHSKREVIFTCFSANSSLILSSLSVNSLKSSLTVFLDKITSRFRFSVSSLALVYARR